MQKNKDLIEAYNQIKSIYNELNRKPERLKSFLFSNKWTMIFTENEHVGIAFNFTGEHSIYGEYVNYEALEKIKEYVGKEIFELIDYLLLYDGIQERSVCVAALNCLSQAISSEKDLNERNIKTINPKGFNFLKKTDIVTVVGYGGVTDRLYDRCKELHILDMRSKSSLETLIVGEEIEYFPKNIIFHGGSDNSEILQKSDVVIMSGCTIVNGTFKDIIENCKNARIIGIFGPSAQIIPEYLFENGINYILSNRVSDSQSLLESMKNPFYGGASIGKFMELYAIAK